MILQQFGCLFGSRCVNLMKKASKQDKSVNFVQTVGTNDCFSTEPVISICFFGERGGVGREG